MDAVRRPATTSSTETDYEFHERIETVAEATAERDELVTLSVPADDSLGDARERVETERASAEYIDSDRVSTQLANALANALEYASERDLRQLVEAADGHLEAARHARGREALERLFTELLADGEGETEATSGREEVDRALEFDGVETLDVEEIRALEGRVTDAGRERLVVSTGFEEGRRLERTFGGAAALLRFPIQ